MLALSCGCAVNVHTHHADETLVSVSSQYLPLQLSDSSLQSLHGGSRRLLLRYSGAEEREERRTEKCLVLTLQDIHKVRSVWKHCSLFTVHISVFRWCLTSLEPLFCGWSLYDQSWLIAALFCHPTISKYMTVTWSQHPFNFTQTPFHPSISPLFTTSKLPFHPLHLLYCVYPLLLRVLTLSLLHSIHRPPYVPAPKQPLINV